MMHSSIVKKNGLEIHGIPKQQNEYIIELVKKLGMLWTINETTIDACHRLRSNDATLRPPGIIVKFVRRLDVDTLLGKRRDKRNLNTSNVDIQLPQENIVCVNESICLQEGGCSGGEKVEELRISGGERR